MGEPESRVLRTTHAESTGWRRWLPGLDLVRRYDPSWLKHDVLAGLVLTTMLVPVGIAYAEMKRFGLFERLGGKAFFATLGEAVNAYLKAHPVEWEDWTDRAT